MPAAPGKHRGASPCGWWGQMEGTEELGVALMGLRWQQCFPTGETGNRRWPKPARCSQPSTALCPPTTRPRSGPPGSGGAGGDTGTEPQAATGCTRPTRSPAHAPTHVSPEGRGSGGGGVTLSGWAGCWVSPEAGDAIASLSPLAHGDDTIPSQGRAKRWLSDVFCRPYRNTSCTSPRLGILPLNHLQPHGSADM